VNIVKLFRDRPLLIWLLVGISIGGLIALVLLSVGLFTRKSAQAAPDFTPVVTIIRVPSATPTLNPTATPVFFIATPSPTSEPADPGVIATGQLVEIIGTGGDGLRLRVEPGLDARIAFLGVESEVFEVLQGPETIDGYQWWLLGNPYNAEKTGWAVSIYLRSIASP
jgi:hypothetical protein